jgi:hypothetical protein
MTAYRCTVDGLLGSCVILHALPCWHAQCDEKLSYLMVGLVCDEGETSSSVRVC